MWARDSVLNALCPMSTVPSTESQIVKSDPVAQGAGAWGLSRGMSCRDQVCLTVLYLGTHREQPTQLFCAWALLKSWPSSFYTGPLEDSRQRNLATKYHSRRALEVTSILAGSLSPKARSLVLCSLWFRALAVGNDLQGHLSVVISTG